MVDTEVLTKVPMHPARRQGAATTAGSNWRVAKEGVHFDRHTSNLNSSLLPTLPKTKDRRRGSVVDEGVDTAVSLQDFAQASMEDLRKAVGVGTRSDNGPSIASVFMAAFWEKRRRNQHAQNVEVIVELNKWLEEHGAMVDVFRGNMHAQRHQFEDHHTSKKMPRLIFHPFHPYRLAWDVVIMTMLFYSLISVPYVVAFASTSACESSFFKQVTAALSLQG